MYTNKQRPKKDRIILISTAFAVTILVATSFFWFRFRPKLVLVSAVTKSLSALEERFRESPMQILLAAYNPKGNYTADMNIQAENPLLGSIDLDMTVKYGKHTGQIHADGTVQARGAPLSLKFYGDNTILALSTKDFEDRQFFGITFDTFSDDLKQIPFINMIVSDNVLQKWDGALKTIRPQPSPSAYSFPSFTIADIRKLIPGLATLPCTIESSDIVLEGSFLKCSRITYSLDTDQVQKIQAQFPQLPSKSCSGEISFYLSRDSLVRVSMAGLLGDSSFQYCLNLGVDPKTAPLRFQGSYRETDGICAVVNTQSTQDYYTESWDLQVKKDGITEDHGFTFAWDPAKGDMVLQTGAISGAFALNFKELDTGFQIKTDDLPRLFQLVGTQVAGKGHCDIRISSGASIEKPEFINLDQWSMEDFLTVLGNVGSIIGLSLE